MNLDFCKIKYDLPENFDYTQSFEEEEPKTFSCIAHEEDILQMYLKSIGKIKLLKPDEERELGRQIQEEKGLKAELAKKKLVKAGTTISEQAHEAITSAMKTIKNERMIKGGLIAGAIALAASAVATCQKD